MGFLIEPLLLLIERLSLPPLVDLYLLFYFCEGGLWLLVIGCGELMGARYADNELGNVLINEPFNLPASITQLCY